MKDLTFIVYFKEIAVSVQRTCLSHLYVDFICEAYEKTGLEPEKISLPNGITIPYESYPFHACFDHGKISEARLIELLLPAN